MKASDIPSKIDTPFATSAGGSYIRAIPDTTATPGAASWSVGFPALCFEQIALGGIPPAGQDFNGVLNAISAWSRWACSGAPVKWDSAFSTAIGGYPKGAIVQSATTFGTVWVCLADDNTFNPDTVGTNWAKLQDWLGITAAYTEAISAAIGSSLNGAAKAWVLYDGVAKTVRNSFNVASVTYNGVGDYSVNFTTAAPSAYYPAICTGDAYVNAFVKTRAAGILRANYLETGAGGAPTDTVASIACFWN